MEDYRILITDPLFVYKFWSYVNRKSNEECWLWFGALTGRGYGNLKYNKNQYIVHRISYQIANPDLDLTNWEILHHCDIKNCVNPNHLFHGTQIDNINDCINKNRHVHGMSKLNNYQIIEIRQKYKSLKYTQQQLADEYNIDRTIIGRIINYEIWKHIK